MKILRNYLLIGLIGSGFIFTSCGDDDAPEEENEVEVITDLTLVFTDPDGNQVTASAQDPDGIGVQELQLVGGGVINLDVDTEYTLTFQIDNALDPDDVEDIGEEIEEEDDEHQIFFAFTSGAFASPPGDGNIDATSATAVNYQDEDSDAQDGSGNPIGLETTWTTGSTSVSGGEFRVRLQHQPDIKSSSTDAQDGDTDFDVTFVLNIQ